MEWKREKGWREVAAQVREREAVLAFADGEFVVLVRQGPTMVKAHCGEAWPAPIPMSSVWWRALEAPPGEERDDPEHTLPLRVPS